MEFGGLIGVCVALIDSNNDMNSLGGAIAHTCHRHGTYLLASKNLGRFRAPQA